MCNWQTQYPSDLKTKMTMKVVACAKLKLKLPFNPMRALCTPQMRNHFAQIEFRKLRKIRAKQYDVVVKGNWDDHVKKLLEKPEEHQECQQTVESGNILESMSLEEGKQAPRPDALAGKLNDEYIELVDASENEPTSTSTYDVDKPEQLRQEFEQTLESDNLKSLSEEDNGKRVPRYDALAEALREAGYVESSDSSESDDNTRPDEASDEENNDVTESDEALRKELICQVIYAIIGFDGKYLRINPKTSHFYMIAACQRRLERCHAYLVLRTANLGFYYKVICNCWTTLSELKVCGSCGRALASALSDYLSIYINYAHNLRSGFDEQLQSGSIKMTLLQLARWQFDNECVFKWLRLLLDECMACVIGGTHILCALKKFACHGNPELERLAKHFLCAASEPLFLIMERWLNCGDVYDSSRDFFIIDTAASVAEQTYFPTRYKLCLELLPPFLEREMADKILAVGKCHKFEQLVMKEYEQFTVGNSIGVKRFISAAKQALLQNDDTSMQECSYCFFIVFGNVLKRCHQRLEFMCHLRVLNKFVLLTDGSFVRLFIDDLAVHLDKNVMVSSVDADKFLKSAWHRSCDPFDDENKLQLLTIVQRKPVAANLETGWDTLEIVYRFEGPVTVLLKPTLSTYSQIFKLIWQLHRVTFVLYDRIWNAQQMIRRTIKLPNELVQSLILKMYGIIHKMRHVVGCLRFYYFTNVIQAAWLQLGQRVEAVISVDDLLTAHQTYLDEVEFGLFQNDEMLACCASLKKVYDCIFQLHDWQKRFLNACTSLPNQPDFFQVVEALRSEFDAIDDAFEDSITAFLSALSCSGVAKFESLFDALDFNFYYEGTVSQKQLVAASFKSWHETIAS